MNILTISGSLRAKSANTAALGALELIAPTGITVSRYRGLETLPYFNPDLDVDDPPAPVAELRSQVGRCDGLVICSPEYAHGVSGVLKNALDWLVRSLEFPGTPVALINVSPRARASDAQLRETLVTMSANLVTEACVDLPLNGLSLDDRAIAAEVYLASILGKSLDALVFAADRHKDDESQSVPAECV